MRMQHAVILAAGVGTRMKSETPKVLHTICGRPMIAHAVDLAMSAGVKQPVIVLGYGEEQVKSVLPKEVKVVIQAKPLGTADAVIAARKAMRGVSGDVLILYGDTPLVKRTTIQRLAESHAKSGAVCTLLTAYLADPSGYGRIVRNETGSVVNIIEEAEATLAQRGIREVNVGPLVCRAQVLFDELKAVKPGASRREFYLTRIVSHIAHQEGARINAARVQESAEALGINTRVELSRAINVMRQRIIAAHLHNGVTIEDPETTHIDHGVRIGLDTIIRPHTVIEAGVTIGKRCTIGPFARLRSGVSVADNVRIGNFVELVRSNVGSRVRINHMTYLGDTTVAESANIGAGTITANYDGQDKHQTQIGKGALIGSDTIFVAPVRVGPGGVTGAGTVVTRGHDVPPEGIAYGVPARVVGRRDTRERAAKEKASAGRIRKKKSQSKKTRPKRSGRKPSRSRGYRNITAGAGRPSARRRSGLHAKRARAHAGSRRRSISRRRRR